MKEAFRWEEGVYQLFGHLPGGRPESHAFDVSADGSVVVGSAKTADDSAAFIWDERHGMRTLESLLQRSRDPWARQWTLRSAAAVSDDGRTIVGSGWSPDQRREGFILTLGECDLWGRSDPRCIRERGGRAPQWEECGEGFELAFVCSRTPSWRAIARFDSPRS